MWPPSAMPMWPPSLSQDSVSAFMFPAGLSVRRGLGLGGSFRGLQVYGARLAALVLLQVVRQALVLNEAAHAGTLDSGDVNEGVIAAPVRLDEAVALALVEKFNGADRHV